MQQEEAGAAGVHSMAEEVLQPPFLLLLRHVVLWQHPRGSLVVGYFLGSSSCIFCFVSLPFLDLFFVRFSGNFSIRVLAGRRGITPPASFVQLQKGNQLDICACHPPTSISHHFEFPDCGMPTPCTALLSFPSCNFGLILHRII